MKKIVYLSILIIIISILVYFIYNKPHRSVKNEKVSAKISAVELFNEYETDELSANKKYLDKVLIVNGTLAQFKVNDKEYMLILASEDPLFGVSCTLQNSMQKPAVKIGEKIKIKGICKGYLNDVVLTQCMIVQ